MPSLAPQRTRLRLAAALCGAACLPVPASTPLPLRCYPGGPNFDYRWELLKLALAHTGADARLSVQEGSAFNQSRAVRMGVAGDLDVLAFGTNAEREAQLLPVRFDISFGIVGMRLLLVRREDQERIARMDSTSMRKALVFGLNTDWADLPILRANGFKVVTSSGYDSLFAMLAEHRFDAFPRGLNEALGELDRFRDRYPDLEIERTKALYFSYPIYFWVNRSRHDLALRIERGLHLALADGSLRKLFMQHYAREIASLSQSPREVILLRSDALPPGYVEPDTSWWWPRGTRTSR